MGFTTVDRVKRKPVPRSTLPDGWSLQALRELSPSLGVGCVINPSVYFDDSGTVPMLLGSNIRENKIDWNSAKRITDASNRVLPASRLNAGDLVTVRVGEPGITAVIPPEWDGCNCASMMVIRQSPRFSSLWLCYVMNSRIGRAEVDQVKYGSAQKQFNISDAINFTLPVPPLGEQRAIAAVLSDVDRLIESLEKLIAKKRAIKQAAMQQLLTGKTRLPGYEGGWRTTRLGRIGRSYSGLTGKSKADFEHGDAHYVTFLGVLENVAADLDGCGRVVVQPRESQNAIQRGDVLFNGTSETPEDLAMGSAVLEEPVGTYLNSFCFGYRLQEPGYDPLFLAYYFRGPAARRAIGALAQGATRYNLSKRKFLALDFELPEFDEQLAIVSILSDMDAEISALERRRDKTKAIKQGTMQTLLTGRVRLVKPGAKA